jgi:hypothetical protein
MPSNRYDMIADCIDGEISRADEAELPRGHLGMSSIGNPDERLQWLRFRWCLTTDFPPKVLRIFELGNIIESEVVRLLRLIPDLVVYAESDPGPSPGLQHSMHGGHYSGSMDGVLKGLPTDPGSWYVLEVKSANAKSFKRLINVGLKEWNVEYWTQCQCYMHHAKLERCLFVVYCKDTSELEYIVVDAELIPGAAMIEKARRIIETQEPPSSPYPEKGYFESYFDGLKLTRFMSEDNQGVYRAERLPDTPHCRNCRFAYPCIDGPGPRWECRNKERPVGSLSISDQLAGCINHLWIPWLMPRVSEFLLHDNCTEYRASDNSVFWNVSGSVTPTDRPAYASRELVPMSKRGLCQDVVGDPLRLQMRGTFAARETDPEILL